MAKKIISLFFVLMLAVVMPATVFAEDTEYPASSGTCGDNITWSFNTETETLTISGTGEMYEYAHYNHIPWIGWNYIYVSDAPKIRHVVVEEGITKLCEFAFYNCSSMVDISLPEGLTNISSYAFFNCKKLEEVNVPSTVENISDLLTFASCDSLRAINIAEGNPNYMSENGVFFDKAQTVLKLYPPEKVPENTVYEIPSTVKVISNEAFEDCGELTKIIIPDGVEEIPFDVFKNCKALEEVVVPDSITHIDAGAFQGCEKLKSIEIPYGMTEIEGSTFSNCKSLSDVVIPDTVTEIGSYAFSNCETFGNVVIPSNVEKIDQYAFRGCTNVKTLVLNEGLKEIGDCGFFKCTSLEVLNIPASLETFTEETFSECTSLNTVNVAEGNPNYMSENGILFSKDKSTLMLYPAKRAGASYIVPSGVTRIGSYAFAYCENLQSVRICEGVTQIGSYAFVACKNIYDVVLPNSLETVYAYAFSGTDSLAKLVYIGLPINWTGVTIQTGNDVLTSNTPIYACGVTFNYATNGGTSVNQDYVITGLDCYVNEITGNPEEGITKIVAVKDGWEFCGWSDNPTDHLWLAYYKVTTPAVTLYAIYRKDVTTSFYSDGELLKQETVTIYNNETSNAEAPVLEDKPIDAQYTDVFKGWDGNYENITENTSVNAVYERTINKYAVKFMHNDEVIDEITLDYGSAIGTLPAAPTVDNYKFVGYFNGETEITADTVVTGDITAMAKYLSTDISIENLEVSHGEDSLYNWSIDVKCDTDEIVGTLIIALYDENDAVVGTQIISVSENAGTNEISDSLKANTAAVKAKAFLWVDMATLQPITNAAMAEI